MVKLKKLCEDCGSNDWELVKDSEGKIGDYYACAGCPKIRNVEKNELKIKANFGQDKKAQKEFEKGVEGILKPLQKIGILKYNKVSRRICDYCGEELKENDKFKTLPNGKDICSKCEVRQILGVDPVEDFINTAVKKVLANESITQSEFNYLSACYEFIDNAFVEKARKLIIKESEK